MADPGGIDMINTDHDGVTRAKRGTRPGSIRQVRLRLWWAINEASLLLGDEDKDTRMKAISALSTAAGVYVKLTETQDFEKRLDDLQKELSDVRETLKRPASASKSAQESAFN